MFKNINNSCKDCIHFNICTHCEDASDLEKQIKEAANADTIDMTLVESPFIDISVSCNSFLKAGTTPKTSNTVSLRG